MDIKDFQDLKAKVETNLNEGPLYNDFVEMLHHIIPGFVFIPLNSSFKANTDR